MIHLSGPQSVHPARPARGMKGYIYILLMASTHRDIRAVRMTRNCLGLTVLSARAVVIYLCLLILTNAPGTGPASGNVAPAVDVSCHRPWPEKSRLSPCLLPRALPSLYNES